MFLPPFNLRCVTNSARAYLLGYEATVSPSNSPSSSPSSSQHPSSTSAPISTTAWPSNQPSGQPSMSSSPSLTTNPSSNPSILPSNSPSTSYNVRYMGLFLRTASCIVLLIHLSGFYTLATNPIYSFWIIQCHRQQLFFRQLQILGRI